MLRRTQLILAGLLVVMASAGVSYAVAAAVPPPETFVTAGTTRYVAVMQDAQLNAVTPVTWQNTGLLTSFIITAGRHADVMLAFCSQANPNGSFIKARALINTAWMVPNAMNVGLNLAAGPTVVQDYCVNFFLMGVAAGSKTVRVQWYPGSMSPQLYSRSMIITVNIH